MDTVADWSSFRERRDRIEAAPPTLDAAALRDRVRRLETLLEVCNYLALSLDLHTTLSRISEVSRDILDAAEASIMILDERTETLYFEVLTGDVGQRLTGMRLPLGEGIAGRVAQSGAPSLVPDCSADPDHARRFDEVSGFKTRSILCVPLVASGQVVGVLEAVNKRHGAFNEVDLDVATGLAQVAGASVLHARLYGRLKEAQADMVQAGKLAALGTIAAGIAHELNQPLTGILGFVQLLQRQLEQGPLPPDTARDHLGFVEKQVRRMTRIIDHVRTFGQRSPVEMVSVSLNHVAQDATTLMTQQFVSHGIRLDMDLEEGLPAVRGDAVRLEEVVINLLSNARIAIEKKGASGGRVQILTRSADGRVCIEVADNGTGIAPDVLPRIFDPFFTTGEGGKGTGLGLSLSHGIVRDHGGTFEVDSLPGQGATFRVRIPIEAAAVAPSGA